MILEDSGSIGGFGCFNIKGFAAEGFNVVGARGVARRYNLPKLVLDVVWLADENLDAISCGPVGDFNCSAQSRNDLVPSTCDFSESEPLIGVSVPSPNRKSVLTVVIILGNVEHFGLVQSCADHIVLVWVK